MGPQLSFKGFGDQIKKNNVIAPTSVREDSIVTNTYFYNEKWFKISI